MASAESRAFKSQFSTLLSVIDNPLTIAAEAYSRDLISRDVMDKMLVSTLTAKEKAAILLTSVESHIATNQQSFHEFVRVLKTQTNLVQTAENLQMDYWKHQGEHISTTANLESPLPPVSQPVVKRMKLDDSQDQIQAPSLTLKNLSEELVDVIQWYMLGIKLNLPQSVLATIEVNHPRDVERCRVEMLTKWLQRTPTASWRDIVQALYEMDLNSVAQRVQQVHGVPFTGVVPPSGTLQVGGQFVGTANPPQQTTGGEQSVVTPSQPLLQAPMPTVSQPAVKRMKTDDNQVQTEDPSPPTSPFAGNQTRPPMASPTHQPTPAHSSDAYHSYCSNVRAVYQRGRFQKEDCWPPMQKVKYINLAILKSDKLTFSDDYTLMTIQRSADDIVSKKKKIGYKMLFDGLDSGVRILVEGRPGCGKTTLMNKVSLDWAKKIILKEIELLLLVPLRRFHKKQEVKLDDILRLYDTGHLYNAVGAEVSKSGGQGLCIVFDGIDEYPQSSVPGSFVLDVLAGRLLPNSVVIASSRPAAAHDIRKYATQRVEVLGFLRPEIQQYIQEHYDGKDDEVKNLSSYLEHHPNIRHMCYLPLHLAMIVYLNDILPTKSLPHTETDVYSKFMFHTLLHDLQKSDNTYSKLSNINQLPVESLKIFQNICRLAYIATDQSEQIFTRDQIQEHIGSREFNLKSLSLLTEDRLLAEQGLEETYSFAHLTFQEFLAAHHLTKLPDAEQLKTAEEHGGDRTMIMVWRFYCGLTKLSGETPRKVFQAILKQHEINTLLLSHGVHESQNESACHELLSSRSGVLSISDEVITPADSLAVSYCMKNAVTLLKEVSLDSCYLGDDELRVLTSGCSVPLTNVKCLRLRSTVVRKKTISSFAALLEKFPNLESFEFTKCSRLPSNEDFIRLFSLINLKSFTTDVGFIRMGGIQQLLTKFQHLEHMKCHGSKLTLEMTLVSGKVTSARVVRVKRNQESEVANLQSDLDSYDVNLVDMRTLHEGDAYVIAELLQMYPGAQSIDLSNRRRIGVIGDKELSILVTGLKECQNLKKLHLDRNSIGQDGCSALSAVLQQCKQLQVLSLGWNAISEKGVSILVNGLKECQSLKELNLGGNGIRQEGCSALTAVLQQCKQLQVLGLAGNKVGDEELSILANGLKECQNLKELYLDDNNIRDDGCAALSAALQECKELQQLSLDWNKLTDASIQPLTTLIKTLKSLTTLWLRSNNFTAEGRKQLRQAAEERKSYPHFVELHLYL